jgi:hypothetical protein
MKEKKTGSGHMKATASNLFLQVRCSASDHPLAWLIDGQTHCGAVWRRRHIVKLRRQRTQSQTLQVAWGGDWVWIPGIEHAPDRFLFATRFMLLWMKLRVWYCSLYVVSHTAFRKHVPRSYIRNMHVIDLTFHVTKCNRKVTWAGNKCFNFHSE